VTSWASYKAFANHAEKFNKAPEDVSPPGQSEPVKVVHDGPGTHAAGGGGSGGGVVQQKGGSNGNEEKGGHGHEKQPSDTRSSDIIDGKPADMYDDPEKAREREKEKGKERKPSGQDEAWHDWEREEMEKLLNEVRGHLGMPSFLLLLSSNNMDERMSAWVCEEVLTLSSDLLDAVLRS